MLFFDSISRAAVKSEKETTAKTVRTLKTEESKKIASATTEDDDDVSRKSNKTTIKRDQPSFFKR